MFPLCKRETPEERKRRELLDALPVHRALYSEIGVDEGLVQKSITTVNKKDFDNRSALDIIFDRKNKKTVSAAVLYLLLEENLPFDRGTGQPLENPYWAKAVQQDTDVFVEAIQMVLNNFHETNIDDLANAEDGVGRVSLNIASPKIKKILVQKLLLYRQFELLEAPPVFRSKKYIIVLAKDHSRAGYPIVALKFFHDKRAFSHEVGTREACGFESRYVLPVYAHFDGDDPGQQRSFRRDAIAKGFESYPHCIVTDPIDFNMKNIIDDSDHHILDCLHHIIPESYSHNEFVAEKYVLKCTAECLAHIHSKGFIHGDIRAQNVVLVGKEIKFINLDHSVTYRQQELHNGRMTIVELANTRLSFEYKTKEQLGLQAMSSQGNVAPEMLWSDVIGMIRLRMSTDTQASSACVKAEPSQDIWGFGTMMYYLLAGHTLFHYDTKGDIVEQEDMSALFEWTADTKRKKLRFVEDLMARDLLAKVLHKNPTLRPSAEEILMHPYITGGKFVPPAGMHTYNDVFLCYRHASDREHAELIYRALRAQQMEVWFDENSLQPGTSRMKGFRSGIVHARNVVVLLSRHGLKSLTPGYHDVETETADSDIDMLVFFCRLALEMKKHAVLHRIIPILIGDEKEDKSYGNYMKDNCHPNAANVVVKSVENLVCEMIDDEGWGVPLMASMTVKAVLDEVLASPDAVYFEGEKMAAVDRVVTAIQSMTSKN